MIVDFVIKNYRSFKNEQVLSSYVGKVSSPNAHVLKEHPEYLSFLPNESVTSLGLLRTIAIYGANAAGKSNTISAMVALGQLLRTSTSLEEGESIAQYDPYLLDNASKKTPTQFEVEFFCNVKLDHLPQKTVNPVRFLYRIEFNSKKILSESLSFFSGNNRAILLFDRTEEDTWETIRFSNYYKGGQRKIPFFPNQSYLSKAGSTAAAPNFIREVYRYLTRQIICITGSSLWGERRLSEDQKEQLETVGELLHLIDTGVETVSVTSIRPSVLEKYKQAIPTEVFINQLTQRLYFNHLASDGSVVKMDPKHVSEGTLRFFNFTFYLLEVLKRGLVVFFDELESQFHPEIVRLIVRLFNDPRVNTNHAQLFFTTHSVDLMKPEIFRRDQVWFAEKQEGATKLYSISDFEGAKVRSNSPYAEWYLEGRFGALPQVNYLTIADFLVDQLSQGSNNAA